MVAGMQWAIAQLSVSCCIEKQCCAFALKKSSAKYKVAFLQLCKRLLWQALVTKFSFLAMS